MNGHNPADYRTQRVICTLAKWTHDPLLSKGSSFFSPSSRTISLATFYLPNDVYLWMWDFETPSMGPASRSYLMIQSFPPFLNPLHCRTCQQSGRWPSTPPCCHSCLAVGSHEAYFNVTDYHGFTMKVDCISKISALKDSKHKTRWAMLEIQPFRA